MCIVQSMWNHEKVLIATNHNVVGLRFLREEKENSICMTWNLCKWHRIMGKNWSHFYLHPNSWCFLLNLHIFDCLLEISVFFL